MHNTPAPIQPEAGSHPQCWELFWDRNELFQTQQQTTPLGKVRRRSGRRIQTAFLSFPQSEGSLPEQNLVKVHHLPENNLASSPSLLPCGSPRHPSSPQRSSNNLPEQPQPTHLPAGQAACPWLLPELLPSALDDAQTLGAPLLLRVFCSSSHHGEAAQPGPDFCSVSF